MASDRLVTAEYRTIHDIAGPLVFVRRVKGVSYEEMVEVESADGRVRNGQVIELNDDLAVVQVFGTTHGLDVKECKVRFQGDVIKLGVSIGLLGRVLNGLGEPIDGGGNVFPEKELEVTGSPINPYMRDNPNDFIQTGVSAIDGLNTLVRGQKLPIFSGSGLPGNELAAQIVRQAKVIGGEEFAIIFGAMGITRREASFFQHSFSETGALERVVFFMNLAEDPTVERLITPRCALTMAEFLAFSYDMQVLVILTDMTNYCEALREISAAREEVPGRRGYPGYMYTDLASLYERAGRIKGKKGSITQVPILTMPDDDITHPIADLTGYITEGQIVLSRPLHNKGVSPPIDVLPCLSRLMNQGIGEGKTRGDHRGVADQLYAYYAEGVDLRRLVAIIGEEALSEEDQLYLKFADQFEESFLNQADENRDIEETLEIGWNLLSILPSSVIKRIKPENIEKYYPGEVEVPGEETEAEEVAEEEVEAGADIVEEAEGGEAEEITRDLE
ncbi:MAG: V-type ATP synthase subunit B [Actinobacteria bacterium]|nr:V-type ATP synthase subunit B [Actinomycetota bacterium]MCG2820158.1 V-type ATP synthase subunit B [Actinomycetes bacterium]MBU4219193.1 V-type ATP synthase subunit B [Actinomycetota bacterium]MBU4359036.1 V-type ATP synthase subunit B [Actinomycetota bacterium]MBU4392953.1 V-type ATP synthase subunit B [Actinomycetota bacterium]